MIQSFSDYLAARAAAFHETERIGALEMQLWGNPRLGPVAQARGEVTIATMKAGVVMLRELLAEYEATQISPVLTARLAEREAMSGEGEA